MEARGKRGGRVAETEYKLDDTAGKKIKVACQHCGADKNHVVMSDNRNGDEGKECRR